MAKIPRHHRHLWHRAASTPTSSSRSVAVSRRAIVSTYASQPHTSRHATQQQQQRDEAGPAGADEWELTSTAAPASNDVDHLVASTSAVTLDDRPRASRPAPASRTALYSIPAPKARFLWSSPALPITSSSCSSSPSHAAPFSSSAPARITLQWLDPNPPEIVRTWSQSRRSTRPPSPPDRTLPPADFDFAHHDQYSSNSFYLSEADGLSAATFAASSSYHGANGGSGANGGGSSSSSSSSSSDGGGQAPGDLPPSFTSTTTNGQPGRTHTPTSPHDRNQAHSKAPQAPAVAPVPLLASSSLSNPSHTSIELSTSPAQPSSPRSFSIQHDHSPLPPLYEFRHGAYGIPKRHPLAAQQQAPKKRGNANSSTGRGVLAAAADFLAGPVPPPPPPRPSSSSAAQPPKKTSPPSTQPARLDPDTLRSVQVGEDSYFLRSDSFGIADGVGGWATRPGANPALFSRLLMHFCSVELSRYDEIMARNKQGDGVARGEEEAALRAFWEVDPVEVMHRAWERCVRISRREGILGSSTALLAMLRGDQLRIANLGDCVLLIVRRGHLLFRSQEQQHSFNFPVQLGMMHQRGGTEQDAVDPVASHAKSSTSPPPPPSAAAADEDLDSVEPESLLLEQRRKHDEAAAHASAAARRFEEEEAQREREERRRRAEFEGKDMKLFDAELEAGQAFDFDPQAGAARTASSHATTAAATQQQQQQQGGLEDSVHSTGEGEARSTVYVGFDDSHPWDEPRRDCGRWTIQVQRGDVIILASDGLVDNLFDDDILEEVQRFAPPADDVEHEQHEDYTSDAAEAEAEEEEWPPLNFSPQLLSEALCSRAKSVSQDSKAIISPFQQRATEEGLPYVGGKHDDISVLVAVVVGEDGGDGRRLRLRR